MAYVYRHIKPNGEVFYIGIGKNKSRLLSKANRNKFWHSIVNKYGYEAQILIDNISWDDAGDIEKILIDWYGRRDLKAGSLVNLTDGGEGCINMISNIGSKRTPEQRERMSIAQKGLKKGRPAWNKGKKGVSEETSKKLSLARLGKPGKKGIKRTKECIEKHRNKISGGNNVNSKIVLNVYTGIFYECTKDAADSINIKRRTLIGYLSGHRKNKTDLIYA